MSVADASARRWRNSGALLLTALIVYGLDRLTKSWVEANLALGETRDVVGDFVQVWHVQNSGAAFSLFQGAQLLFLMVGVAAVVLVAWFHRRLRDHGPLLVHVILGLILGGALGNLAERMIDGTVTDWISVGIGSLRFPTFNVADASLSVGVVALLAMSLLRPSWLETPS